MKRKTIDAQHLKAALQGAAQAIGKRKRIGLAAAFEIIINATSKQRYGK